VTSSVVIVAFRAGEALTRCLRSLEGEAQEEIVVVDNGALGDEVAEAGRLPGVRVVSDGTNLGFAGGCNAGAASASGDVLVFLNPDTVVAQGAVGALAETAARDDVAVAMARLRLLAEPERLNSSGNVVHVSGLAWAGGYGGPAEELAEERDVAYASGAALAVRADLFRELGGFTERLFMYQEDLELCWKARSRGGRIVVTPAADVLHDYHYDRNPGKQYLLERNRLVFVLTAYPGQLLVAAAPVLLAAELALAALAVRQGWFREKARGWAWCARNAPWLARHRRETQRLRRVPEGELARFLAARLDPAMIDVPAVVRVVNPLVAAYWRLARRALPGTPVPSDGPLCPSRS
jgi:GT2 family glycosyltransferase